jgi:hypothetical protein
MRTDTEARWWTVRQAAERLQLHPDTVRRRITQGDLPACRLSSSADPVLQFGSIRARSSNRNHKERNVMTDQELVPLREIHELAGGNANNAFAADMRCRERRVTPVTRCR